MKTYIQENDVIVDYDTRLMWKVQSEPNEISMDKPIFNKYFNDFFNWRIPTLEELKKHAIEHLDELDWHWTTTRDKEDEDQYYLISKDYWNSAGIQYHSTHKKAKAKIRLVRNMYDKEMGSLFLK